MENATLTHPAEEKRRTSAIRVSLVEGGASGPFLGLTFDKEKPQDETFHVQGLTFIMDKRLLEQCGTINIDFIEAGESSGFKITAANPLFSTDEYSPVPYGVQNLYH